MSNDLWHYEMQGKSIGPVSTDVINQLITASVIQAETVLRKNNDPQGMPACEIEVFRGQFPREGQGVRPTQGEVGAEQNTEPFKKTPSKHRFIRAVATVTVLVLAFLYVKEKLFSESPSDADNITLAPNSDSAISSGIEIAESIRKSTVKIEVYFSESDALFDDEGGGTGSGFIVSMKDNVCLIATNSHVWGFHSLVEADDDGQPEISEYIMKITFYDNYSVIASELYDHPSEDFAVIRLEGIDRGYSQVSVGKDMPEVGEEIYTMGHPLGLDYSFSKGVVSAVRNYSQTQQQSVRNIQIDAPISPGNSGGPLVNTRGLVVGINTRRVSDASAQNLNFALSVSDLIRDYKQGVFRKIPLDPNFLTNYFIPG